MGFPCASPCPCHVHDPADGGRFHQEPPGAVSGSSSRIYGPSSKSFQGEFPPPIENLKSEKLLLFSLNTVIHDCIFQCSLKNLEDRSHLPPVVIYLGTGVAECISKWVYQPLQGFARKMTKCCHFGVVAVCSGVCSARAWERRTLRSPLQARLTRPTMHTHICCRHSPQPKSSEPSQNS